MLSILTKIDKAFSNLASWLLILLVSCIVVLLFGGVVGRYIFNYTPFFAEELSRYLLIWIGCIGASIAIRNKEFMAIDLFIEKLPNKLMKLIVFLTYITIVLFLVFLFLSSLLHSIHLNGQKSATLPLSMMWPALAVPFGVLLMFPYYLISILSLKNKVKI